MLAGRLAGVPGQEGLADYRPSRLGVFLEIGPEAFIDHDLNDGGGLARPQAALSLPLELGVGDLQRNHRVETRLVVVPRGGLSLFKEVRLLDVLVEGIRQAGAKPRQVGSPVVGPNIVGEGVDPLVPIGGVAKGDLHPVVLTLVLHALVEVDDIRERLLPAGEVLDVGDQALGEVEGFLLSGAGVLQADFEARGAHKVGHFPKSAMNGLEIKTLVLKNLSVRTEGDLGALPLCVPRDLKVGGLGAAGKGNLVPLALPVDLNLGPLRKRVHHRKANAVEPPGNRVGLAVELSSCVKLGHHQLHRGNPRVGVDVDRDSAPVVHDCCRPILVQGDGYDLAKTGQGLVH